MTDVSATLATDQQNQDLCSVMGDARRSPGVMARGRWYDHLIAFMLRAHTVETMPIEPSGLAPLFKWTGGKRRELPQLLPHAPSFVSAGGDWRFVEPFAGGAAMFFALAPPCAHLNDTDFDLINFYRVFARQDPAFLAEIDKVGKLFGKTKRTSADHDAQEAAYYAYRDLDRKGGLAALPDWKRAARFYIVTQLAFSGMRRFNADGEFNIPFGHYKSFDTTRLHNPAPAALLKTTTLTCGGYEDVLAVNDLPDTFIFLDPPYTRVMKTYSAGNTFGDAEQRKLAAALKAMTAASWMMVIDRSELTEELYGDYIVHSYAVSYGANIRNRFDQGAQHIVATNYQTDAGAVPPVLSGV